MLIILRTIIGILVLAGVVLGPGYLVYCHSLRGTSLGEYSVYERDVKSLGERSFGTVGLGQPLWEAPPPFEFSPEMNPIELIAVIQHLPPGDQLVKPGRYQVAVRGGEFVWVHRFEIRSLPNEDYPVRVLNAGFVTSRLVIGSFEVPRKAEYTLYVTDVGRNDRHLRQMVIDVRRNALVLSAPVCKAGFGILGLGLLAVAVVSRLRTFADVSNLPVETQGYWDRRADS